MRTEEIVLFPKDALFPDSLKNIPNPPAKLYCLGNAQLLKSKCVAVVGSRKMTEYGMRAASEMVRYWVQSNITIVSGLAMGVDSEAHKACLDSKGATIAVIPSGVSEAEPKVNRKLASKIIENGGLVVSEHPKGTTVYPSSFLERNRLIAGLSLAVVVIEAAYKSGAISTVNHALEQGKDVFTVPGSIYWPYSEGTNNLIKQGAFPLTHPKDVMDILHLTIDERPSANKFIGAGSLTESEQMIINFIGENGVTLDHLQNLSHLETQELLKIITNLEIKKLITQQGATIWRKV